MMRVVLAVAVLLALAGCGSRSKLLPVKGAALPVAPYGAQNRPDADALLVPDPQAMPERSVELRKRSEERQDDPFDFPPKG